MDIFSLKNKVALVTGAAHGIGFQMAVALANAGAKIAFNSSNESSMKKGNIVNISSASALRPLTRVSIIPIN
jgi:NAD(P)-dependent dehydrogenase (short-subunit alcohol dehydrogenase family)